MSNSELNRKVLLCLTITIFPSFISLTNVVSLPSHFCVCTNLSPSMVKVDCRRKQGHSWTRHILEHQLHHAAYFNMTVIRCCLIKLLSQFGRQLGVSEGALGLHHHLISILADHYCGFGDVAHLSCGKTNTCQNKHDNVQQLLLFPIKNMIIF